jgi:hypothetical protein
VILRIDYFFSKSEGAFFIGSPPDLAVFFGGFYGCCGWLMVHLDIFVLSPLLLSFAANE